MALRFLKLLKVGTGTNIIRHNLLSTSLAVPDLEKRKSLEFKTEDNLVYHEDPDKFGNLASKLNTDAVFLEDEGDIKEESFIKNVPMPSQKLTTRQYADIIKQYLKHKRLKEAMNVLEVKMLKEDRVKPENYIYNILIGACAEVGYTKKAFKLYNEMKRRALQPTGDTYTCLFEACTNSPWPKDGLKNATHLRQFMIEKGIEPNLTNYNTMIKAFGRCGDLPTAFKIVDEMLTKKIKIRVHTFNHLLQACITDKDHGLRHALIVWRKMLTMREKPNIYSFNLMLKCVKECNLGSKSDIEDLIRLIEQHTLPNNGNKILQIESRTALLSETSHGNTKTDSDEHISTDSNSTLTQPYNETSKELTLTENQLTVQIVNKKNVEDLRVLPNLLSKELQMQHVLALQQVETVQDKFSVIGGQEDFLKEMEVYSVQPDIKIFTQMLFLIEDNAEAEKKLLVTMRNQKIRADIDFYNMLIKKRCLRQDYDATEEVLNIIKKEGKLRKRLYPDRKKLHIKPNVMTYGVIAMSCKTKEKAEKLLEDMKAEQIKVNIEILGTLLRQGTAHSNFGYVLYIMNLAKEDNIRPNPIFLKHLETFSDKCIQIIKQQENTRPNSSNIFKKSFSIFTMAYKKWLKDININEALETEHPWSQFNYTYPETLQRQNITVKEPKKFYKRDRKYVKYVPKV